MKQVCTIYKTKKKLLRAIFVGGGGGGGEMVRTLEPYKEAQSIPLNTISSAWPGHWIQNI